MKIKHFAAFLVASLMAFGASVNAQTAAAAASAAASSGASASSPTAAVTASTPAVGKPALTVKFGTATGVATIPETNIPFVIGPASTPSNHVRAKASANASASANATAKASDAGRLVVMRCDNSFTVTPTAEKGTVIHEARNCVAPTIEVPVGIRIIEAPMAQSTAVAIAAPAAIQQAFAPPAVAQGPAASSERMWLWHPHDATEKNPKACIVESGDGMGMPPYCTATAKVIGRLSNETKNQWLVRVGGGARPTDTGLYTKK